MNVLISGGGIAGLSAGILLSREGFKVNVFERSSALEDLGTGVQISPNGYKILQNINQIKFHPNLNAVVFLNAPLLEIPILFSP